MPARFKPVPEPPARNDTDAESIERARRAIPLVPATEAECCVRLRRRLSLGARDAAREWLTFLRALSVVVESEGRFRRRHSARNDEELANAFRERVYGAREVLSILDAADEPMALEAVVEEFAEHVPRWERFRYVDPEAIWRERAKRITEWAIRFEFVSREADGRFSRA